MFKNSDQLEHALTKLAAQYNLGTDGLVLVDYPPMSAAFQNAAPLPPPKAANTPVFNFNQLGIA